MKEYNIEDYLNPELSKEIIEELVKENIRLELKENAELKNILDCKNGTIETLKAENERLKEEIETRDNLIDHFRDEALYRATIASEYQKDKTKLEQTLQEIKKIAEEISKEKVHDPDIDKILNLIKETEQV